MRLFHGFLHRFVWDGGPVHVDGTVREGDRLAGFEVVDLPGHAPGLIGLWRERDRVALVSDCFYMNDMYGRPQPPGVPLDAYNLDTEQARRVDPEARGAAPGHRLPGASRASHRTGRGRAARSRSGGLTPAMAERNVEIVRRVYECVNERRWDALAELLDPDVVQYGTVGGLEEGTVVRGSSEIVQLYESEADAWDWQRVEPERLIDAGDRVVRIQGTWIAPPRWRRSACRRIFSASRGSACG